MSNEYENVAKLVDKILTSKQAYWDFTFGREIKVVKLKWFNP